MALALLGAIAAIQGVIALWAVGETERHVWRGRVAADIKIGFMQLIADKQLLRNWVAQRHFRAGADSEQRDALLERMRETLARLNVLAARAEELDDGAAARARQADRRETLKVLDVSLGQLGRGLANLNPPPVGADSTRAWQHATELFDRTEGADLRRILKNSMTREDTALREKRAHTDDALALSRQLWAGSTAALVIMALVLAASFARALRFPLLSLTEGAAAIREGRLSHRIPLDGRDEFSAVARSINTMAEELAEHRRRETDVRQALEEQVASRTAELSAALEAQRDMEVRRRRLFADISHELRTPTTAIRGEAQVTLRGGDKPIEDYKTSLKRIEDASRQLGLAINDLLTMARSDIDQLSMRRTPIDLADVLNDAHTNGIAMARAAGVNLVHEPWPEGLRMHGDADRLKQLLLTLIDNAVRYSHSGQSVRIKARVLDGDEPKAVVQIEDEGIGIAPEDLGNVFDRNYRAANAVRHRSDGSGLGLSIARTLARGHGGDVSIASQAETGTTAVVTLPLAELRKAKSVA